MNCLSSFICYFDGHFLTEWIIVSSDRSSKCQLNTFIISLDLRLQSVRMKLTCLVSTKVLFFLAILRSFMPVIKQVYPLSLCTHNSPTFGSNIITPPSANSVSNQRLYELHHPRCLRQFRLDLLTIFLSNLRLA